MSQSDFAGPRRPPKMTRPRLRVTVAQDDAYRAVFADGAASVANKIEQAVYSSHDRFELIHDLHAIVKSARELADREASL